MSGFFGFLAVVAILFFILALIKPEKFIFWKKKTRGSAFLYLIVSIVFIIIASTNSPSTTSTSTPSSATNEKTSSVQTSSGKYSAGKDFQPGYYDIELVSGQGNVMCTENQLNAIFSKDASFGVTKYKNVKFEFGNILQVEGTKIKLTPSK